MQTFIESGGRKINEVQSRFHDLQSIFDRYDTAKNELELSDEEDQFGYREQFENRSYEVKAKFSERLHTVINAPRSRSNSLRSSGSGNSDHTKRSYMSNTQIKLPTIELPSFEGETCSWLHYRDKFEAMIVNNTTLSNVEKFIEFIASEKNDAKYLISNLQITNENILLPGN